VKERKKYEPPRIVEDLPLELTSLNCAGHFGKSSAMCHPSQHRS